MSGARGVRARVLNLHISTLPVGDSAYSNDGCRCQGCRAAWAAYCNDAKEYRASRVDQYQPPHGVYSTYTNYKCRCDECKRANRDHHRAYIARRRAAGLA